MRYAVVAHPSFSPPDARWIEQFRAAHDALYFPRLRPRFVLVYPAESVLQTVEDVVRVCAQSVHKIDLVLGAAAIHKDHFAELYHVSLIPDQGLGQLLRLYDALHTGPLSAQHLIAANYVPHLGIGNTPDPQLGLQQLRRCNAQLQEIRGRIDGLEIVACPAGRAPEVIETVPLRDVGGAQPDSGSQR